MYIGRFLRYNSWDIIQHPQYLIKDISHIIFTPREHADAWAFTLSFGAFLFISFKIFKTFSIQLQQQEGSN